MKKDTQVSFSWPVVTKMGLETRTGAGTVITDEEDGKVLVACDPEPGDARHFVIQCTVTWLTVVE